MSSKGPLCCRGPEPDASAYDDPDSHGGGDNHGGGSSSRGKGGSKKKTKHESSPSASTVDEATDDEQQQLQQSTKRSSVASGDAAAGLVKSVGKGAHNMAYGVGAAVATAGAAVTGRDLAASGIGSFDGDDDGAGDGAKTRQPDVPDTRISYCYKAAKKAGISAEGVERISTIQNRAHEKIGEVDGQAAGEIAAIYEKAGLTLDTHLAGRPGHMSVKGASSTAAAVGLGSGVVKQVTAIEKKAVETMEKMDEDAIEQVAAVYKEEEVVFNRPGVSNSATTNSASGVAEANGLNSKSVKKVTTIETKACDKIASTNSKAVKEISKIYKKAGIEMERPVPKKFSPKSGRVIAGAVAVSGAAGAAAAAGLSSADVKKVAAIESKAVSQIDTIEEKAADDIANVYKKESVPFVKPGLHASRAANIASTAGLSNTAVKKVASVEKTTSDKVALVDDVAMGSIATIYRENGVEMPKPKKRALAPKSDAPGAAILAGSAVAVTGAAAAASRAGLKPSDVSRIADIEKHAGEEMETINADATKQLTTIYKKEGLDLDKPVAPMNPDPSAPIAEEQALSSDKEDSSSAAAAAAALGGTAAAAAAAAGLGAAATKKVAQVEKKSEEKVAATERKAISDIASIYKKSGTEMPNSPATSPRRSGKYSGRSVAAAAGVATVAGAAAAAAAAGMSASDVSKIAEIEKKTKEETDSIKDKAAGSIGSIYEKEGVPYDAADNFVSKSAGAAAAVGLSVKNQQKIGDIESSAADEITSVDDLALAEIDAIYRENGMAMKPPRKEPREGSAIPAAAVGVTGAAAAAAAAGLGSLDIARISEVERKAEEKFSAIDREAGDEMGKLYEKEGQWFDKPGRSRAAAAAAGAGLGLAAVSKIAEAEETAERQIDYIDSKSAKQVEASEKEHAEQMHKYAKKGMSEEFMESEEEAALLRYESIAEQANDKISGVDERTEDAIAAIYSDGGKSELPEKSTKNFFTKRGAEGASKTAAAIRAAKEAASKRKILFENLQKQEDDRKEFLKGGPRGLQMEEPTVLDIMGEAAHMAVYDVGATVAKAGTAITYHDMEGPEEFEARETYTPEQRARACCG